VRPVADTSFLLALVDGNDPHHAQAQRLLDKHDLPAVGRECLAELLQITQFKTRKSQGASAGLGATRAVLAAVLGEMGCAIEPDLDVDAVRQVFGKHRKLSWVDAAIIVQARGRDLLTFDKEQEAIHAMDA